MDEFVLDKVENPHPKMLTRALRLRARSRLGPIEHRAWTIYLLAMCDATGETPRAIGAWMNRQEKKVTTVYLAGPINGCTDDEAHGWRQGFMDKLPGFDFLDPMVRDYRGREDECVKEIIEGDKQDIRDCDVFLAYCWQVGRCNSGKRIERARAMGCQSVDGTYLRFPDTNMPKLIGWLDWLDATPMIPGVHVFESPSHPNHRGVERHILTEVAS